jgi:hypothetical protein
VVGGLRLLAVTLLVAVPGTALGQRTWVVQSQPQADLWYAALAQIPFEGFSGLPLYDAALAGRMRDAKRTAGVTTALDRRAREFQAAFLGDSAFEILHFVPIYFVGTDRTGMMDGLRAAAAGRDPRSVADPRARYGAAVLQAVLATPEQRRVLGEFVEAVEDEWSRFFGRWWSGSAGEVGPLADSVQALWDRDLARLLRPFLAGQALDSGLILVSPAVGPDGRVFAGRPDQRADNVVAVGLPLAPGGATWAAAAVAREACYPLASATVAASAVERRSAEQVSGRLAVRCGALLLQGATPALRDAYERRFAGDGALEPAFPVPEDLLATLRGRLR